MKKLLIGGIIFVGMTLMVMGVSGQVTTTEADIIEEVTLEELGVEDPGTLPDSRWYFLKEWRRGFKKLFTFGAVQKAQTDLEFINERAAELKEMARRGSENIEAITDAAERYRQNMEELKTRMEALRDTSENQNIDELLDKLVDRAVKHEQLFDELKIKFENREEIQERLKEGSERFKEIVAEVPEKFEDASEFTERLKEKIEEYADGNVPELRKIELVDRIGEKLSEAAKERVEGYKEELKVRFEARLKEFEESDWERVFAPEEIKRIPGDYLERIRIIDEVKVKIEDRDVTEYFEEVREKLFEDRELDDMVSVERVRAIMSETRALIERVEGRMSELTNTEVHEKVKRLVEVSKLHLQEAEKAIQNGKVKEAFGLATSALAEVKSAIRYFIQTLPLPEVATSSADGSTIACPAVYIASCERDRNSEQCKIEVDQLIRKYPSCGFEVLLKRDGSNDEDKEDDDRDEDKQDGVICIQEYTPVCGSNGKTYSNKCFARAANVEIKHDGVCGTSVSPTPSPTDMFCTQEYAPVCAHDGKTYSNKCFAARAGVGVKYDGMCESDLNTGGSTDAAGNTSGGTDVTSNTGSTAVIVSIAITADGFVPQEVKIKKGTRVQWVNRTSRLAWPASAVHPTHTEYPEKGSCTTIGGSAFDSCRGLASGEAWSFPFNHAGTWKYHDHLNSGLTGAIIVTE